VFRTEGDDTVAEFITRLDGADDAKTLVVACGTDYDGSEWRGTESDASILRDFLNTFLAEYDSRRRRALLEQRIARKGMLLRPDRDEEATDE